MPTRKIDAGKGSGRRSIRNKIFAAWKLQACGTLTGL
jgi:hypothetical protein